MATREDIKNVATRDDIRNMATKEDLRDLERKIDVKIANLRTELIRWMFVFWIGQFASIVGVLTAILFAFFR